MDVFKAIERIEESAEHKEFLARCPDSFLAHAFIIKEEHYFEDWQIGYYCPSTNKITVFQLGPSRLQMLPESEVFKHEEDSVKRLDITLVKMNLEETIEKAMALAKEKYPQVRPIKHIIILQHLPEGQVWNITFVGQGMDVLNIKVNSVDGQVIAHGLNRIFQFKNSD